MSKERIYIHKTREFATVQSWSDPLTCTVITCPVLGETETRELHAGHISYVHWSAEHQWPAVLAMGSLFIAAVLFGLEVGCEKEHSISCALATAATTFASLWSFSIFLARRECEV